MAHKNNIQTNRFFRLFSLLLLTVFFVQELPLPFSFAEEEPPTEQAAQPPELSKEQKIEMLRHEQDSMKTIYEDEKWEMKEDLRVRLQEIEDNQEGPSAKREAVRQWKQDVRNLKAAFRQAWSENADEIAVLQGRTPQRRSSGAIEMFKAPPSSVSRTCPRATKVKKGRCRRRRVRRCRRCR